LSSDPGLFVEVLKLVFRADGEEPGEVTEEQKAKATRAFRLLQAWQRAPGTVEVQPAEKKSDGDIMFDEGRVDQQQLLEWVKRARSLAAECGRLTICDLHIGEVLAHAPRDADGTWPCEPVRNLIEELQNVEIERGLQTGLYNRRGAHCCAKGGTQERQLAEKFRGLALPVQSRWPRTAAILNRIGEQYEREGRWNDEQDIIEEFR